VIVEDIRSFNGMYMSGHRNEGRPKKKIQYENVEYSNNYNVNAAASGKQNGRR
jgi:hypothetical protein